MGAPFYYSKTAGGAAYLYLNKNIRKNNFKRSLKLTGKPESRFSFALASAGSLNKDKYEDLAVGAPYEKNGFVYIYLGSANGLRDEPSQVIDSSKLPSPINTITTFGYSLSGNLDLDRNSYPDLLVGAYESDAIVVLRSRPIIQIKTSVRGNLDKIDPRSNYCEEDSRSKTACIVVQPCFNLSQSVAGNVLKYRIEAETFIEDKKFSRVSFKDPLPDHSNIVEREVILKYNQLNHMSCAKETIYIQDKRDIQSAVSSCLVY